MTRFPAHIIRLDLGLCALFAVPGLSALVLAGLGALNALLDLPGALPPIEGGAHFFVNFAGLLGGLLNYVLLRTRDRRAHGANVIARGGVIALLVWHIANASLPALFGLFAVSELLGGLATLPWLRSPEAPPAS